MISMNVWYKNTTALCNNFFSFLLSIQEFQLAVKSFSAVKDKVIVVTKGYELKKTEVLVGLWFDEGGHGWRSW